jgi:hypothetical protein
VIAAIEEAARSGKKRGIRVMLAGADARVHSSYVELRTALAYR